MIRKMRGLAAGAALALASVLGGCAGYGWEDGYGGGGWGSPSQVSGRVEGVQTRLRTIQLRRDNGRRVAVHYDGRTDVVSQGRRQNPESLDPGDYVSMRVTRDSRGRLYARDVNVRREAPDRVGSRAPDRRRGDDRWDARRRGDDRWEDRRDRRRDDDAWRDTRAVEGRVGRVDRSGRRFELRGDRGNVWVTVPRDASRGVRERFQRLRTGEHVRVAGRYTSRTAFRLEQFR